MKTERVSRAIIRQFIVVFIGTAAAVLLVLRTDLVERISYAVEKGRLRALSEALPSSGVVNAADAGTRIVAELVTPAVVYIKTMRARGFPTTPSELRVEPPAGFDFERDHPPLEAEYGLGSGFIFDAENGYVMTNYHVAGEADRIEVILADGRRFDARVVGADLPTDLAVLQIPAERLHELAFGESSELAVGDEVFALGNPFGLEGTFSRGIVSALGRRLQFSQSPLAGVVYQGFIQTDATINPGNSGGPLVNRRGEVVGINTAIASHSGMFSGVGFAIPSSRAAALIPKLIEGGVIVRGFLGVRPRDVRDVREMAEALRWHGDHGVIVFVQPGTPADRAGLKNEDVLVEIDGKTITGGTFLMDYVAVLDPGTSVELRYWRDGEFFETRTELARRPDF